MAIKEGKSRIMFVIEDEYKKKIEELALKEDRSVSNCIAVLLKRAIDEIENKK